MGYTNALETMSLTENNSRRSRFNNLVRVIVGVGRDNKRRMDEMRVEIGAKESVKKKLEYIGWSCRQN